MVKIGILQTGRVPPELADRHDDYDILFQKLLEGNDFTFQTWAALDGDLPDDPHAAEGWLITGSKFGVYEDLPWIVPLEAFIRRVYAADVPLVGVCFGHQILAQALGGRVEKFAGGWATGLRSYDNGDRMMAWHQDQVVEPPADAQTLASNDFCAHAMLAYGKKALSVQPHPEYDAAFIRGLFDLRGHLLPKGMADAESARLEEASTTSERYNRLFAAFFKDRILPTA